MSYTEQTFQNALMLSLSRAGLRVWRQPTGQILTHRRTAVKGAPVGAADLTGIIPGLGVRLEVECKGARTPLTAAQTHWLDTVRGWGGVAVLVRAQLEEPLDAAVARCCAEVLAAVEARRAL